MPDLALDDFRGYFEAVHGSPPFEWQSRLLRRVVAEGRWPDLLDLPTGSGKTASIDIALFHLAFVGSAGAPRRIVMVVDRRTVVDQSFARAVHIARSLRDPGDDAVKRVAERLRALAPGCREPLGVAQLRGGMPRDDSWARTPDQPLVVLSTVDQVGSRLLFRGYGVSEGMRSVHAGLLGNDTLFLLDEVHLSQPFRQTLRSVSRYRTKSAVAVPNRWQVVAMSATPDDGDQESRRFGLDASDAADERLMSRVRKSKPVTLVPPVKVTGLAATKHRAFALACAAQAEAFAGRGRIVGVVLNRVDSAREASAILKERFPHTYLVTGRMRPLDRDDRDAKIRELVGAGRRRDPGAEPVVVVATQCIEAGADFDFDALVTECASLDALRQRFGRLNRRGDIDDARAVVLVRSDNLDDDDSDPVYGDALLATWRWLGEAPRDFGIDAMNAMLAREDRVRLKTLYAPHGRAPVMLPSHLDAWVQTRPSPYPDPDVALWLHGVENDSPSDVQLVWRADVRERTLDAWSRCSKASETLSASIDACAPVGLEAVSLPAHAVRAWLAGSAPPPVADVEGLRPEMGEIERNESRRALRWDGESAVVISAYEIAPGDTLIVPSEYGGLTDGTWDPASTTPVSDLGHRARWQQTRRPVLRLLKETLDAALPEPPVPSDDDEADYRSLALEWLEDVSAATDSSLTKVLGGALLRSKFSVSRIDATGGTGGEVAPAYLVLIGRRTVREDGAGGWADDDGASMTGVAVSLTKHMCGVERWASRFAASCGLPESLRADVALAARWHDAGKADARFQRMLQGPKGFGTEGSGELLAKSATPLGDRGSREAARLASRYPRGARHELSSVALIARHTTLLSRASDRDLVLHLVASHHGWCRPFAPCALDPEPIEIALEIENERVDVSSNHGLAQLDSGISDRFWRLTERYGWYGLAWLEAILRLADHRRSEEEQQLKEDTQ